MGALIKLYLDFKEIITAFSYSWFPETFKIITLATFVFLNSYRQRQLERNRYKENIDEKGSKFVYRRIKYLFRDEESLECAICLSEFKYGDQGRKLEDCNHMFHESCLEKWLMHGKGQSTCPLCRNVVISENIFEKFRKVEYEGRRNNIFEEELALLLLSRLSSSRSCCQRC
ncbi:RING-H2 finger protein ATL14-like [Lycium ferocissimum]|uniref:RING-H2 finger protein ATL14-like n=1 Tax=Lycium ferocissimum TaxID=112874 RepID=UPI00281552F7|nr:RING-H2 finger protein ATL14-like [Lycium ferocissimum]